MKYYFVSVENINSRVEEITALALEKYNCVGQADFNLDEPAVDEILGERAYSGGDVPLSVIEEVEDKCGDNSIKYFFENEQNAKGFYTNLKEHFSDLKIDINEDEVIDWNQAWRKHYKKIVVDDVLAIYPEWEKHELEKNEIAIYPGQGFGTGGHETTWLCISHFGNLLKLGRKLTNCLDFGCGSGVLGIAAIKRLSIPVDFCDIDKAALDNCLQNLSINFGERDLSGSGLYSRERFKADKQYDLVFANILLNILVEEQKTLCSSVRNGGYLVVSGVLNDQVEELIEHYKDIFEVINQSSKGDWSAITFEKK